MRLSSSLYLFLAMACWGFAAAFAFGCTNSVSTTSGDPTPDPTGTASPTPTPVDGPPEVIAQAPAPGNPDAWVRSEIAATFNEPIDETSLPGNVTLYDTSGTELPATLALEDGGVTLVITPDAVPATPNQLTVELGGGITDIHGERLVEPAGLWTWTLNEWQTLATDVSYGIDVKFVRTALTADGSPLAVWYEDGDNLVGGGSTYAAHYVDGIWLPLNGLTALVSDPVSPYIASSPDGRVAVVVSQDTATGVHPFVYEWDGSQWSALGNALTYGGSEFSFGKAIAYLEGQPVIAWSEGSEAQLYVARWSGSSWQLLGGSYVSDDTGASSALSPAFSVEKQGQLLVTWQDASRVHVREWNGSSWLSPGGGEAPLPPGTTSAFAPSVSRLDDGSPVVSLQAYHTADNQSHAFVYRINGANWEPLGGALNEVNAASVHSMLPRLGGNGNSDPTLVWEEGQSLYVRRWSGSAWLSTQQHPILDPTPGPAMGIDVRAYSWGAPVVSVIEEDGGLRTFYVWRHNS